jgi:hypothetical protein
MPITASQIFDFIQQQEAWTIQRYEIASAAFGAMLRSLRQIASRLRDSDDQPARDVLDGLRALLSEWLTVPVPFDRSTFDGITDLFGPAYLVQARWGFEISTAYDSVLRARDNLISAENPMREKLREIISDAWSRGLFFKIYCHKSARPHFDSLFSALPEPPVLGTRFLHSLREYRETELFDLLIKVGPLRARGWSAVPDAVMTAPRFGTLAQIVWSGSRDDADFGDPAFQAASRGSAAVKWNTRASHFGDDPGAVSEDAPDSDDLSYFRDVVYQAGEKRSATLIEIDKQQAIVYPPYSRVLSFDPDPAAREPIDHRIPYETLQEGMFLILPNVETFDFGDPTAQHGIYSQIWKDRLKHEFRMDEQDLIDRLRGAGLTLVHLRSAIERWCEPPNSVIHAPQLMKHFEILTEVLRLGDTSSPRDPTSPPWWRRAWGEIRRSRGEAIQSGFAEKEIVEEQLIAILRGLLSRIREQAAENMRFSLSTPAESDIRGRCVLFPINAIEGGFHVPESELKIIHDLKETDKWRD